MLPGKGRAMPSSTEMIEAQCIEAVEGSCGRGSISGVRERTENDGCCKKKEEGSAVWKLYKGLMPWENRKLAWGEYRRCWVL